MTEYYVTKKGPVAITQAGPVKECKPGDAITIGDDKHAAVLLKAKHITKTKPKSKKGKAKKGEAKSEEAPDNKALSAEEDK